ncbi:hypothetical protein ETB97_008524 [Aspergillus alliaceus]|uniref:Chitinase n=1 Tax=Petromyces alliaceus TaxID=209559 RepID=A0A8H6ADX8_PETAA|nr:hypothetical protein ETB97_008524 [Aspergillus burnettii]
MAGFRPKRVVAGVLANPANGSKGHLSLETIGRAQAALRAKHHNIGGIMVWEYFNAGQEGKPIHVNCTNGNVFGHDLAITLASGRRGVTPIIICFAVAMADCSLGFM